MYIAEILAISAAICIALSGLLIGELRGQVDVFRLGRWQMTTAAALTGAVALATGGWQTVAAWQFGYLFASSLFGIIFASSFYFTAIFLSGARNTAMTFSMASPFALFFGFAMLGETVNLQQSAGIVLVLGGILLAILFGEAGGSEGASADNPGRSLLRKGLICGLLAALGQALGSLYARPAMASGVDPFAAMAIRAGIAAVFYIAVAFLPFPMFRKPYAFAWKPFVIGVASAVIGVGLGMSLLMAALAYGNVGIVSTLSSLTPVLILPMIWVRTGRPPPLPGWIGATIAVAGTALIAV